MGTCESGIGGKIVHDWDHMAASRDGALNAGTEEVAAEENEAAVDGGS